MSKDTSVIRYDVDVIVYWHSTGSTGKGSESGDSPLRIWLEKHPHHDRPSITLTRMAWPAQRFIGLQLECSLNFIRAIEPSSPRVPRPGGSRTIRNLKRSTPHDHGSGLMSSTVKSSRRCRIRGVDSCSTGMFQVV